MFCSEPPATLPSILTQKTFESTVSYDKNANEIEFLSLMNPVPKKLKLDEKLSFPITKFLVSKDSLWGALVGNGLFRLFLFPSFSSLCFCFLLFWFFSFLFLLFLFNFFAYPFKIKEYYIDKMFNISQSYHLSNYLFQKK